MPEVDFPEECAALYPAEFRYPFGYLAKPARVTLPAVLSTFPAWQRPYVVNFMDEIRVDPDAPVPVRRLASPDRDNSIQTAIRYLEWDGYSDESLQKSFEMEDLTDEAGLWSEAGMHEVAVRMIRGMPAPFRQTHNALVTLVRSLKALERYEEALRECHLLLLGSANDSYWRSKARIEEAELLLHLGRRTEAEASLNTHREELRYEWPYYAMRAALALQDGDAALAENLVLKAGRANPYHAYKMLWNGHLKSLSGYIRRTLLTDAGEPRLYEQNVTIMRLCHGIHGALLTGRWEQARRLEEGLLFQHINDQPCAEAFALALVGLGRLEWLQEASAALPGQRSPLLQLVRLLARFLLKPEPPAWAEVQAAAAQTRFSAATMMEFAALADWLMSGRPGEPPSRGRAIVADVAPKRWSGNGRDHFLLLHDPADGLRLQRFYQDNSIHRPQGWTLPKHFPVLEDRRFTDEAEAVEWLEVKFFDNDQAHDKFPRSVWDIHLNGWVLATLFEPEMAHAPWLAEVVRLSQADPSFYFSNGPACSFGLDVPWGDQLIMMLRSWMAGEKPVISPS